MCLGSEGCLSLRAHGTIRERGHGRVARFGQKEWQADHADAEYVTAMHPVFAKAVAKLLDQTAWMLETEPDLIFRTCVDETIGIARAYLGEPNRERATDDAEAVTS
jgi:predicted NAD/FAD-dependent oxidoreductase